MSDRVSVGQRLSTDRGSLVNIASWFLLVLVILAFFGKVYIKWTMAKLLDLNDLFVGIATLMAIALSVTIASQVSNGLGEDVTRLEAGQLQKFYLASYLTSLFYVLATFFTKLAALHFYLSLSRDRVSKLIIKSVMGLIMAWMVVAILVTSFQCSLPKTWDLTQGEGKCINEVGFWAAHGAVDFLTQIPTAFLPVYLLWNIQTNGSTKLFVMLSFSPGILTVPLIVLRLVYIRGFYSFPNGDPTENSFNFFLITSIHANLAIILGTIPLAKPVIDALSVGVITNDIGFSIGWDKNTAGVSSGSNNMVYGASNARHGGSSKKALYGWRQTSNHFSNVEGGVGSVDEDDSLPLKDITGGQDSNRLVIRETRTMTVTTDDPHKSFEIAPSKA